MSLYHADSFVCPRCGREAHIEQVLLGAEVYTKIRRVTETGAEYDVPYINDYESERYICSECGAVFAKTEDELRRSLQTGTLVGRYVWDEDNDQWDSQEED